MFRWLMAVTLGLVLSSHQTLRAEGDPDDAHVDTTLEGETPTLRRKEPFPAEEYARLATRGDGVLRGRLFLHHPCGKCVPSVGETVAIAPATRYAEEEVRAIEAGLTIEPPDPRARQHTRYAETDDDGYFTVGDLPAGDYFVAGSVSLPGANHRRQAIVRRVRLEAGDTLSLALSRHVDLGRPPVHGRSRLAT
ncbi:MULTISPECIES: carboxypeptidase-like regulatory domain-containing protein [unclassified Modicisalibacter]|uniref:carboxypeptidase-like regulatory domain-containing protein n=1 Tax=unclassified Modicisalibacter TaxID=2679913 RepID=UPI001CCEB87B|nr:MULTISPECIES: carboxypeptidase-like regulatory domain-containing protein [unclassified Modicisalibacter]MBZ9557075.1 carboxypeptidase regulatory-like domain-containing protein [Modicisalibacter sp. R2A 31.J]MBZ9574211.1 carboxypeptidase regulatory-like domain-containing protein [Modicisalibacter sp. MOD 31.J]